MRSSVPIAFAVTCVALVGCATQTVLEAPGGIRSDGNVDLSSEYGLFENPEVEMPGALLTAQKRCAFWGYTGAEPIGRAKRKCESVDSYGTCTQFLVTPTYQCTGTPH